MPELIQEEIDTLNEEFNEILQALISATVFLLQGDEKQAEPHLQRLMECTNIRALAKLVEFANTMSYIIVNESISRLKKVQLHGENT